MYDAETAALITKAPKLEGLDPAELPQRLTNAYASIVANRIRLRQSVAQGFPDELEQLIQEIKRIALTNEALVSAVPGREDRVPAAFVAASSHHLWQLAERTVQPDARST